LEAARASEERRQSEMRERAEAARRALEAAKAAEAAWRRARDENGEPAPRAVYTTEREFPSRVPAGATPSEFPAGSTPSEFGPPVQTAEFHALSEEMPPLEPLPQPSPAAPVEGDEPMVPVITRPTLPPFEGPLPSTDPMGLSPPGVGEEDLEDTLVRALAGRGQTDPYAALGRTGRGEPPPPSRKGTDPYAPPGA